jgi:DNA-binding IclR family transcriptional regulator
MAGNSGEPGRTVVSKTATILLALAAGGGHTLSSLAHQTRLPVSTVHRLVRDLATTPLVERTAAREYRAGPALRNLTGSGIEPTLYSHGPVVVDELATALNMTVRLGVLDELQLTYVKKHPGLQPGTSFPNSARLPLHATALGKALLAFLPRSFIRLVTAAGLARYTTHSLTGVHDLHHSLVHARRCGIATCDRELHPTGRAVAVPVFAPHGYPICAMEVEVPDLTERTLAHVTPALVVAARTLSREMASTDVHGMPAVAYRR